MFPDKQCKARQAAPFLQHLRPEWLMTSAEPLLNSAHGLDVVDIFLGILSTRDCLCKASIENNDPNKIWAQWLNSISPSMPSCTLKVGGLLWLALGVSFHVSAGAKCRERLLGPAISWSARLAASSRQPLPLASSRTRAKVFHMTKARQVQKVLQNMCLR